MQMQDNTTRARKQGQDLTQLTLGIAWTCGWENVN